MNNPMQIMQMIKNPQAFIQNAMNNSQFANNPIAQNAFQMMKNGDEQGLEKLARNMCKENGINADDVLKELKSQFGM